MISPNKINVYVITGFLGSGKTTFLNVLLNHFKSEKNIVIENEFGKVNIDQTLIHQNNASQKVFELTNGCICCTLDKELLDVLFSLIKNEDQADNLFLETTGIADPGLILAAFNNPSIQAYFNLVNCICLVDTEMIEDYIAETNEAKKQLVFADIILMNKLQNISNTYLKELKYKLQNINELAKIIAPKSFSDELDLLTQQSTPKEIVIKEQSTKEHTINNVLYESEESINIDKLRLTLTTTLFLSYHQVYRIKGFVFDKFGKSYLVQSAGKAVSIKPNNQSNIFKNQLVFIGVGLKTKSIIRLLKPTIE